MRPALAALACFCLPGLAAAEIVRQPAAADVATTVSTLTSAIESAGARVFATVDHGAGATSIGTDIGGNVLLIFGNPKAGTPVMQMDRAAGLFLPLKLHVYEDSDGMTWIAYDDPAAMLADTEAGGEAVARLGNALAKISGAAAK